MKFKQVLNGLVLPMLLGVSAAVFADGASIPSYNASSVSSASAASPGLRSLSAPVQTVSPQQTLDQYNQILQKVRAMKIQKEKAAAALKEKQHEASLLASNAASAQSSVIKKKPKRLSADQMSFLRMLHSMNPLTPEQIRLMHSMYQQNQIASNYPNNAQKPVITSINVDLRPNATPPVISLAPGIVTSLEFLDATGQPWPILSYALGNSKDYMARQTLLASKGHQGSSTLWLQSLSESSRAGNIAVMLQGMNTPVMLALSTNQSVINYRVDLHIPGAGPNAVSYASSTLSSLNNDGVMSALNGIAPANSKAVILDGCPGCQAWTTKQYLYFRTKDHLLSPSWISTTQSADGTYAYKLPRSPVLLAYTNGSVIKINVEY